MKQINTTKYPLTIYADSRQGGRAENQDTCAYSETPLGFLLVVFDGMGGGPSGKLASTLAANALIDSIKNAKEYDDRKIAVEKAINAANQALFDKVKEKPSLKGMGTTATVVLINDYSAIVTHVGDSRVYQFRHGGKKFRTFDHSLVFEMVKNKTITEEQARLSSQSNIITQALGHTANLKLDIYELPFERGDRFMLCSDGIWGMFPEEEIVKIAAKTSSVAGAVESLVIKVDEQGIAEGNTHDNLTIAIIETNNNSKMKEKMSTKTRNLLIGLAALCLLSIALNIFQFSHSGNDKKDAAQLDSTVVQELVAKEMRKYDKENADKTKAKLERLEKQIESNNIDAVKDELNNQNQSIDIISKLNAIILQLDQLKKMAAGQQKNTTLASVKKNFDSLTEDLKKKGATDAQINEISGWMSVPRAKENPSNLEEGHYNSIIKHVESLKKLL